MNRGLIDRFRSLPMARSAVLTGRTLSDIVTNTLGLTVLLVVGLLVGFSFGASVPEVIAGIALMPLIGYAFSWVFAWIGLIVSSPESANAYGFIITFPLTFLSSAFVPPDTLPEPLKTFATDINPFSYMVDAGRVLFIGTPAGDDIWVSIAWCLGLIAVFGSLAVARYRRAVASEESEATTTSGLRTSSSATTGGRGASRRTMASRCRHFPCSRRVGPACRPGGP
jgi:ABC-type multidrug transport system permease subunit